MFCSVCTDTFNESNNWLNPINFKQTNKPKNKQAKTNFSKYTKGKSNKCSSERNFVSLYGGVIRTLASNIEA